MDATVATSLAVLSTLIAIASIVVVLKRNNTTDDREIRKLISDEATNTGSKISSAQAELTQALTQVEKRVQAQIDAQASRTTAIETKVGLFWALVEDLMPKLFSQLNPIHLTEQEKQAYEVYKIERGNSPTELLRVLEQAFDRELHSKTDIPGDETLAAMLMLIAIKSQLVDRKEVVVKTAYPDI